MKTKDIIVKKSKIHGKGVFANRDFKKGEVILKWDLSQVLSKKEVEKLPVQEKKYVTSLKGKNVLMQIPERYVNHSYQSNTTAKDYCDVAKRDIKKREEITADYLEGYALENDPYIKCSCGSKKCKKKIPR